MDDLFWLDKLAETGYVIRDGFLGGVLASQVRADAVEVFASGLGRAFPVWCARLPEWCAPATRNVP